ncbi:MAG: lysophospholipid acyltransferase family protein [Oscillospiraceae bacterium]
MKIKTKSLSYEEVMALPRPKRKLPVRPSLLLRTLLRLASEIELRQVGFTCTHSRLEAAGDGPWLVLMNHSSFIDLEIAEKLLYPRPFSIVCTSDGFVGKEWLMRQLGCIPTQKFVTDVQLIGDMRCALQEKGCSVLMYPEASYSFDGRPTPLPRKLGMLLKKLDVPVVTILTKGAFSRDPLYNGLQKRRVPVSAHISCLLTREEIREKSVAELDAALDGAFTFDNFAWQYENRVEITEPFRADGLNRILYRCARCGEEGGMEGRKTMLTCRRCGKRYTLTALGRLQAEEGETEFPHIPDWYAWERQQVRKALLDGSYRLEAEVDIGMMVDFKAIYMVGSGHLTHDLGGFTLTGCEGKLQYHQGPLASYGLYSDYFWYELGDVICIGNSDRLYYCFPKGGDVVAKTRMAAEELYKLYKSRVLTPPKRAAQEA